ncbi:major facilitator superfamily transporter [Niveomyces insectorum RCEF 264]|uniref:Major facilitator superfamily transporter n=1 Tax=Niveomyces insectorum RCEF 264 TaxID=1081102 RepID=A0A167XQM8_9HYPO|nr:major facilitator superfamily transporter [Niveomyces insectorum RCEF 264]
MSSRDRRRSTPLPGNPDTEADFRSATEAMQRAADAMIAATESFRKQFHEHDASPAPARSKDIGSEHSNSNSNSNNETSSGTNSGGAGLGSTGTGTFAGRPRPKPRRRPISYQPYRAPSTNNGDGPASGFPPTTAAAAAATPRPDSTDGSTRSFVGSHTGSVGGNGSGNGNGGSVPPRMAPFPPPVQRKDSVASSSSRNPYFAHRYVRGMPASPPPTTPSPNPHNLPLSAFFTARPGTAPPRDDAGAGPSAAAPLPQIRASSATSDIPTVLLPARLSMQPQQHEVDTNNDTSRPPLPPPSQDGWSAPRLPDVAHVPSRGLSPPVYPGSASHSPVGGRRPSPLSSSYIDLIEAASRIKLKQPYQLGAHAGDFVPRNYSTTSVVQGGGGGTLLEDGETTQVGDAELEAEPERELEPEHEHEDEPEPILKIGRYTYVRSEHGGDLYGNTLIRDDGSRRFTTQPVRHGSLARFGGGGGRGGGDRRSGNAMASPREPKPKRVGPAGFSLVHETLFVLLICLSQVLMLAGIAQALVPAKLMGRSFPDTSPGGLAWYSAAYGLTSGTFVLPAGRLGDIFGHRRLFILGFVWFAVWSLLAGFAQAVQQSGGGGGGGGGGTNPHRGTIFFILCRALQGVGPAMLVPNGQAMLGRTYMPGPRKNVVMSLFGASAPVGFVVGAVMSSLFAVYASWPWAFWTMAAVCVALAAVSVLVLPADAMRLPDGRTAGKNNSGDDSDDDDDVNEDDDSLVLTKKPRPRPPQDSLWVRMDAAGMLLGVTGLVLVNFAFNQAPIVGWATPYTYFLLLIGLLALGAFAYVEAGPAKYPLVPLAAMRATTNFVLGCTAAGWGCFSVWVYYSVQLLENLRGWSPLLTSAAYAPAPVTGLAASLLTGLLFSRGVKPHWVMLTSMVAFFVGSLLFATAGPAQPYWYNAFFSILVMPFGMDMSNPAAIILLSNSVSHAHQGIAASLVVTVVNYSISLALGIAGSVEAGAFDADNLLVGYRAAQYFGLGLGGLGVVLGTAFLCQSYLRTPPPSPASNEKTAA